MAAMFGPANNFHCGGSIISDQHILTAGELLGFDQLLGEKITNTSVFSPLCRVRR